MPAALTRRATSLTLLLAAATVAAPGAALAGTVAAPVAALAGTGSPPGPAGAVTGHLVPAHPVFVPAHPLTVPVLAAAAPVRAPLAGGLARAFHRVPGNIAAYALIDGLGIALDHRSTVLQAPASTTKLITTGTALLTLGPSYRFRTSVSRTGTDAGILVLTPPVAGQPIVAPPVVSPPVVSPPVVSPPVVGPPVITGPPGTASDPAPVIPDPTVPPVFVPDPTPVPPVTVTADAQGVLHGDLVLTGVGDPSLTSRDLLALARSVRAAGVARVTGGLYLDDSLLDRTRGAKGWKRDYVGGEVGPLSALMVDDNSRSGSAAYRRDPSPTNLALFSADLSKAGVRVAQQPRVGRPAAPVTAVVATHTSSPLSSIVRSMDKISNNTWAELLLKDIGATTGVGSTAAGLAVERTVAANLGITLGPLADGSGLSTLDRLSAVQEVQWLQAMDTTAAGPVLRAALPVSCRDGTLAHRLCGPAAGRVEAKTGTLDYTANLAGYTTTRSGRRVWFAVLADRTNDASARRAIDSAVTALTRSPY